ncbi:hypothetical protein [Mesorhizobium sp. ES1-4]|uniref:hypothetical protein n=1 Tax=Mesorhizobium sp. ES1-4 TaxID=2876627 RepID=UPI001CC9074C|nr:hypothetical protein [Mesorhizobium sp. ES1-4]MBZ9795580.1 hypothetical protein [Mesorhizobium sp. ES1-4]
MAINVPKRNVSDKLGEVPRQIVTGDIAVDAAHTDQLANLMRSAKRLHKAAWSSALFRHGRKIGMGSSSSQFVLDFFVPFLFTKAMERFGAIAVDHMVTLNSRQEAALQAHADDFVAVHKGDVMKALKEMIVLNGHLQERLDALTAPRRATR